MLLLRIVDVRFIGGYKVLWFLLLLGMLVKVPVFFVHG